MEKSNTKHSVLFARKPLTIAIALYSGMAFAQQNDVVEEEILVTGYRGSLASSLNLKKDNVGMVDSILAEDIGDFPDNNLAEAMARIPGVTITRTGDGQGQNISVRGLPASFSRTRLNGMEVQAADYNTTDRAFDYNIFASELFSRIDVIKTQEAKLEEGSLGATVDLHTPRPLDNDDNTYLLGLNFGHNSNVEDFDPRVYGLMSLQNDAGNFGFAGSFAWSDIGLDTFTHNTGRWEANNGSGNDRWQNSDALPDEVNDAFHPRFPRYYNGLNTYESLGLTGSLQWQPADSSVLTLDMLYSQRDIVNDGPALTPISLSRNNAGGRIQTTVNSDQSTWTVDTDRNALLRADLSGVDIRSEGVRRDIETDFNQVSLTLDQDFSDTVRMQALVGTSFSEAGGVQTLAILEAFNVDMAYDYTGSDTSPEFTYGVDLTDPSSYFISEARFNNKTVTYDTDTMSVDIEWDMSDTFTFNSGISHKVYKFDIYDLNRNTNFWEDAGQGTDVRNSLESAGCPITAADLTVGQELGSVVTDWKGQSYFVARWEPYAEQIGFPDSATNMTDPCFGLSTGSSGNREVEEETFGWYAQVDFRSEVGDNMELVGNFGLRRVDTQLTSGGDLGGEFVEVKRRYSDTLPSFNLGLWVTEDTVVRASWSKVMTRPPLGDLTPGGTISGFTLTYNAGNPGLDPFRADASDIAVEWYFSDEGLVSLAWFSKNIVSFISSDTIGVRADSLGLDPILYAPADASAIIDYSTKVNGQGGDLQGWELQYQTPFTFGPEWLQNFGVKLNYTNIESNVNHGTEEEPVWGRLLDQSDESYNGTLWYENGGWEARISLTHTGNSATQSVSRLDRTTGPRAGIQHGEDIRDETDFVDAKVSYRFNDNLTFSLDMLNLTDETVSTMLGSDGYRLVDTSSQSGVQYYLGAQYKF